MLVNVTTTAPGAPAAAGGGRRLPDGHRAADRAVDRDLQQDVRPGHDRHDRGGPRGSPAREVRRRPGQRRPGRQVRTVAQSGDHAEIKVALDPDEAERIPDNVSGADPADDAVRPEVRVAGAPDDPRARRCATGTSSPPAGSRPTSSPAGSWRASSAAAVGPAGRPQRDPQRARDRARRSRRAARRDHGRAGPLPPARSPGHPPTLRTDLVKLADVADTYDAAAPGSAARAPQRDDHGAHDHRQQAAARHVLLRPRRPRRHLDAGAAGQWRQPDPRRPGHRAGAEAARGLLARAAVPDRGRRRTRRGSPAPSRATRSSSTSSSARRSTTPTTSTTSRSTARSATGRGAWACRTPGPSPPIALKQGSDIDEHPPTSPGADVPAGLNRPGVDYSGSAGEQQVVNALLSERTGLSADTFGLLGSLMYGPLLREGCRGEQELHDLAAGIQAGASSPSSRSW